MIRISRDLSLPQHHESVPLRGALRAAGWLLAVGGIAGGFLIAASWPEEAAEILGSLLVVLGGAALFAVTRCRTYEITVGTARLEMGTGPFQQTVPVGAVESTDRRPATGWRRMFADEEIKLEVSVGVRVVVLPSRRPAQILDALAELS